MLYELSFNYWDEDPANDDEIILAVYSSEEQLNKGLEKFKKQPRFAGKEDSFWVSERKINEENDFWEEGFISVYEEPYEITVEKEFILQQTHTTYEFALYDTNLWGNPLFMDEVHDYEDYPQCFVYQNRKKNRFYCFDKEQRKITFETKLEAEMKNYLQETYGISDMNLKAIRLNEMER